ncbi:MAG: lipoate--protein ligase [Bacteroidales bacterium]|nr:lipoate--protein ligase [Bacteroidales bacterium]
MVLLERSQTDPYFNLAAEEFILKNTTENLLMFWQSEPSVVVGKHQNTLKEVNLDYVNRHGIPVIRRISGGGTVYHDRGNINYTLIMESERRESLIDFKKFTQPVIEFLESLEIEARFEGKNNLTIDGKKFSGNSAHVFRNRVIHHGTFLFDSDLDILEKIINPQTEGISDKAIESIRASVTNVKPHVKENMDLVTFQKRMTSFFMDYFHIERTRILTPDEQAAIETLALEKYKSWKWNFGYSPKYSFKQDYLTPDGLLTVQLTTKNGIIEELHLSLNGTMLRDQEKRIVGQIHDKEVLSKVLDKKIPADAFFPITASSRDFQA